MFGVTLLLGLLAGQSFAQFDLPTTIELDIITPQPEGVYKNPDAPWPITFAIQHDNIAETYGYSFGWTLRNNGTRNGGYSEGASIGVSGSLKPKATTQQVWQSLTDIYKERDADSPYQREFTLEWSFNFRCNGTLNGNNVIINGSRNRNATGSFKFYTRPDATKLPLVDVGGSTGQCATLLQTIPILANLTNPARNPQTCPELGALGSDNSTANPCAIDYQGQTTVGTQVNLGPKTTTSASRGSSSTSGTSPAGNAPAVTTTATSTVTGPAASASSSSPSSTTTTSSSMAAAATQGSTGMVALALGLGSLLI